MSHAPAGWYEHPAAPGVARYWDGMTWLAPGVGPSAPTPSFQPHEAVFTPTTYAEPAVGFEAAPMPHDANGAYTAEVPSPYRAGTAQFPSHQVPTNQVPADLTATTYAAAPEAIPTEESVPWDVVGVPRAAPASASSESIDAAWQASNSASLAARAGTPAAYAQQWTPEPYATQYAAPFSPRRRFSGLGKLAVTVALVVVGFGVRWGFGAFFGGDFSDDGRIEVAVPAHWTTYTVSNPDITYSMDSSWVNLSDGLDVGLDQDGARLIDARVLSSNTFGDQAYVIFGTSTASTHGGQASREDFEEALDVALSEFATEGFEVVTREDTTILRSDSGERWGLASGSVSVEGVVIEYYLAVAVVADHALVAELLVPAGSEFSENDLLAITNSVKER